MRTPVRTLAVTFTALALVAGSAQAQSRHGGFGGHVGGATHFVGHGGVVHGGPGYWRGGGYRGWGGWGPGLLWGGIGLGLGLGLGGYYTSPYYSSYVYPDVVVTPPPVVYYQQQAVPAAPAPAPVARSAPDPIVYPRNGQGAAQTEADQRDCNRWATGQRNAMADASVFQRAVAACMDGRGYTIR